MVDLTERPASLSLVGPVSNRTNVAYFEVFGQGGWASFELYNAGTEADPIPRVKSLICPGGVCSEASDEQLNPLETHWRFRADNGTLNWEFSTDAINWPTAATSSGILELTRTRLNVGVYNLNNVSSPLALDGINLHD